MAGQAANRRFGEALRYRRSVCSVTKRQHAWGRSHCLSITLTGGLGPSHISLRKFIIVISVSKPAWARLREVPKFYITFLTNFGARVSGIVRYLVAGQVDVLPFDMRSGLLKLRPGSSLGMGYSPSTRILSVRLGPSHMSYPYTAHYLVPFCRFKSRREPRKCIPAPAQSTSPQQCRAPDRNDSGSLAPFTIFGGPPMESAL
jgi:hypothetical protein